MIRNKYSSILLSGIIFFCMSIVAVAADSSWPGAIKELTEITPDYLKRLNQYIEAEKKKGRFSDVNPFVGDTRANKLIIFRWIASNSPQQTLAAAGVNEEAAQRIQEATALGLAAAQEREAALRERDSERQKTADAEAKTRQLEEESLAALTVARSAQDKETQAAAKARAAAQAATETLSKTRDELIAAQKKVDALNNDLAVTKTELHTTEARRVALLADVEALKDQINENTNTSPEDILELRQKWEAASQALAAEIQKVAALNEAVADITTQKETAEAAAALATSKVKALEDDMILAVKRISDLETEQTQAAEKLQVLNRENNEAAAMIRQITQDRDQIQASLVAARQAFEAAQTAAIQSPGSVTQTNVSNAENNVNLLESSLASATSRLAALDLEKVALEGNLSNVTREKTALERELLKVKADLTAAVEEKRQLKEKLVSAQPLASNETVIVSLQGLPAAQTAHDYPGGRGSLQKNVNPSSVEINTNKRKSVELYRVQTAFRKIDAAQPFVIQEKAPSNFINWHTANFLDPDAYFVGSERLFTDKIISLMPLANDADSGDSEAIKKLEAAYEAMSEQIHRPDGALTEFSQNDALKNSLQKTGYRYPSPYFSYLFSPDMQRMVHPMEVKSLVMDKKSGHLNYAPYAASIAGVFASAVPEIILAEKKVAVVFDFRQEDSWRLSESNADKKAEKIDDFKHGLEEIFSREVRRFLTDLKSGQTMMAQNYGNVNKQVIDQLVDEKEFSSTIKKALEKLTIVLRTLRNQKETTYQFNGIGRILKSRPWPIDEGKDYYKKDELEMVHHVLNLYNNEFEELSAYRKNVMRPNIDIMAECRKLFHDFYNIPAASDLIGQEGSLDQEIQRNITRIKLQILIEALESKRRKLNEEYLEASHTHEILNRGKNDGIKDAPKKPVVLQQIDSFMEVNRDDIQEIKSVDSWQSQLANRDMAIRRLKDYVLYLENMNNPITQPFWRVLLEMIQKKEFDRFDRVLIASCHLGKDGLGYKDKLMGASDYEYAVKAYQTFLDASMWASLKKEAMPTRIFTQWSDAIQTQLSPDVDKKIALAETQALDYIMGDDFVQSGYAVLRALASSEEKISFFHLPVLTPAMAEQQPEASSLHSFKNVDDYQAALAHSMKFLVVEAGDQAMNINALRQKDAETTVEKVEQLTMLIYNINPKIIDALRRGIDYFQIDIRDKNGKKKPMDKTDVDEKLADFMQKKASVELFLKDPISNREMFMNKLRDKNTVDAFKVKP